MLSSHYGDLDTYYKELNYGIERCKQHIETWYSKDLANRYIVRGCEPEKWRMHLDKLRLQKSKREEIYSWFEKRDPRDLWCFVDLIQRNPDIIPKRQLTGKKQDTGLVTTGRDYSESEGKQFAKIYRKAIEKINRCIERENKKLLDDGFNTLWVEIHNPCEAAAIYPHRQREYKTAFINHLSDQLKPYIDSPAERSKFIGNVFRYFYGLRMSKEALRSIEPHCKNIPTA